MNISVAGFSMHGLLNEGRINLFGYLETCRYRYSLHTADVWNGFLPDISDDVVRKVRQEMDAREMVCVNYHVDGAHLWVDEAEKRGLNYRNALAHLRVALLLGAKTVRFDTGGRIEPMTAEQTDYMIAKYGEYARFAHDHGFRVGPETHWGFSLRRDNMLAIAEGVNHPGYGVLLHIGHWEDGDPDAGDSAMAPYTMHTHVDARTTVTRLEEKMKMLLDAGYTGCWGVEHHSAKNEYAEIAVQLAYVRRALSRTVFDQQQAETVTLKAEAETLNPLLTREQEAQT